MMAFDELDRAMMKRALRLAARGEGSVEPNPMVGCVMAHKGGIVGEGWHRRFGGHHAEVEALAITGGKAKGATAYVTLEPCDHQGKTPPCTRALIQAGLARIVVGTLDPNPIVDGRGVRRLRKAGMVVDVGCLEEEAAALIRPFAKLTLTGRPYVIGKWAQTLDGALAMRNGNSKWISSEVSRRFVHRLRGRIDAIIVGIGTVLADDPQLTARDVPVRRVAQRIVLDSRLRIPPDSALVKTAPQWPTWVATAASGKEGSAHSRRAKALRAKGVEVLRLPTAAGLDLGALLDHIGSRGMCRVLVEGGGRLMAAFLKQGLLDEAWVFVAPFWAGDPRAVRLVASEAGNTVRAIGDLTRLDVRAVRRAGSDVWIKLLKP